MMVATDQSADWMNRTAAFYSHCVAPKLNEAMYVGHSHKRDNAIMKRVLAMANNTNLNPVGVQLIILEGLLLSPQLKSQVNHLAFT
jgi:hypothetical protein